MAGLAGLGRIDADTANGFAEDMGVPLGAENLWTRALAARRAERSEGHRRAPRRRRHADPRLARRPPEHLFHVTRALTRVGLEYEARMIAAEAVARL
jgi:hypothetical protein